MAYRGQFDDTYPVNKWGEKIDGPTVDQQTSYSDNSGASGGTPGGSPGLGAGLGIARAFADWLIGSGTNSAVIGAQKDAMMKALSAITNASDKAMGYLSPYQQGGQQDYGQLRADVNSGRFDTPYNQSYTSQVMPQLNYSFDPSKGSANFASFQPQGGPATFTPQQLPGHAPVSPMQPPGGPPQGGNMPPFNSNINDPMAMLKQVFDALRARQGDRVNGGSQGNQGTNPMPPGQQNNPAQNPMGQPNLTAPGRLPFNYNPMDISQFRNPLTYMPGGRLGGTGPYG